MATTTTTSSDSSTESKPRILMLHGGGVSGTIFTIQTRKVLWKLRPHFEFVFLDAPWPSPPGPGVLPVFADAGPFYRWARWHDSEDPALLTSTLRKTLSQPGGEWVGVLGFSQGGRLAAGLCWEQEHNPNGLDELVKGLKFRFAVLVGAAWPLILFADGVTRPNAVGGRNAANLKDAKAGGGERENTVWDESFQESIHVPSVHCIGKQDQVAPMARMVVRSFEQGKVKVLEPNIGHYMPLDEEENGQLCEAILEAYRLGGGSV